MSVDNLSISFASSMGIGNIKEEFLKDDVNLYTDLDDLEKSVEAEFEQYMNQARSFPFHNQSRDHPDLKDASMHSDYDILGAELIDQVNDEKVDNGSWQFRLATIEVDENYNVKPLRNTNNNTVGSVISDRVNKRAESPGAYFGARSLPLSSMDDVWQQTQRLESLQDDISHNQDPLQIKQLSSSSKSSGCSNTTRKMLEARFKSLPKDIRLFPKYELPDIKMHHPYTQKNFSSSSSISSTHQQCSVRDKQSRSPSQILSHNVRSLDSFQNSLNERAEEPPCIIEPNSPLCFLCEIGDKTVYAKVVHLKITNSSPNVVRSFSLFSQSNLLEFELSEGVILEHEIVDIKIKIRSSVLSSYRRRLHYQPLKDKLLVLIDKQYINELEVQIDFISLDDDEYEQEESITDNIPNRPKCKYCALEKGYSLHCL